MNYMVYVGNVISIKEVYPKVLLIQSIIIRSFILSDSSAYQEEL